MRRSPEGAAQSHGCVAPSGLRDSSNHSQGLRPGLLPVAPLRGSVWANCTVFACLISAEQISLPLVSRTMCLLTCGFVPVAGSPSNTISLTTETPLGVTVGQLSV